VALITSSKETVMSKRPRRPRPAKARFPGGAPAAAAKTSTARRTSPEDFAEEYAYVWRDLRRIAVAAVVMFLLMILLNVVIRFAV
jgi:hypothetical protein